jgi:hypothetical protein
MWTGFFAAFAIAGIWLLFFDREYIQSVQSGRARAAVRMLILLLIATQLFAAARYHHHSDRQQKNLADIRVTIVEAITKMEMKTALQHTLRHYHLEAPDENATLEQVFRTLYADQMDGDGTWHSSNPNDDGDVGYTYQIAAPDSIVLAVAATFTRGDDPGFTNSNQQTGMFQSRVILTEGGLYYEREN